MKKKRLVALLSALTLVLSLTACGGSGAGTSGGGGTNSDQASGDGSGSGEYVKLVVWGNGNADTEDCNEVAEAVNKITREKIGCEIELVRGQDAEQINLALTSGEAIDLMCYNNISGQFNTVVNNNWAYPLDDLLEKYGQGAKGVINEYDLEACKKDGVLYALPNQKDTSRAAGFAMRKDICDELGITVPEYGTYDDMHEILVKVHEAHPEMDALVPTWAQGGMQTTIPADPLGDSLGILEDCREDSTTVVDEAETKSFQDFCKMMWQWNQEGLIMPDATTTTENALLSNNGFAMYENWKPGKELEVYKGNGKEVYFMKIHGPIKHTAIPNGNSWMIPYSSKHPEEAMKLWNLMYTDPEISNLFINGIEGKHWVYTDDTKKMITSPEGVDPNASGYSSMDWAWPNQQITPVWEGAEDPDLWTKLNEFNNSGEPSPAMGFIWDSSPVMNQVTACNNVVSSYRTALLWGAIDPEENLPKYIDELKAAGIDEIIAEKQKQLDAFLASK
ncbi:MULTISPECIES: ABC transporter substrate-binding protein [unclassified Butyrivibrio]|uniref:ABC transporter substrate-binding protein n=1 Tax=unclassified Butyrivibrio TaxID=2639466 RepID=UPI0003FB4E3F|nr:MULTISPECIES: ABC transporter substrate-binding protein [unclassified Butyrivibrio]SEL59441.1 putative aldouronate transport system substrate-binding protein [Butyrivibrio sp. ob235]